MDILITVLTLVMCVCLLLYGIIRKRKPAFYVFVIFIFIITLSNMLDILPY